MFDIAWSEFLVVAVVALVVVGPKDLPALLRTVGKTVASLRRMAGDFQSQFNEAMREAELDGLKDELTGMKDKASRMVGASPFQIARDEIKNALTDKPKTPSALAGGEDPAKVAADAPSALAPAPQIEPTPEPPAPTAAEFKPVGAPAMKPVEPELQPKKAPSRARKTAAASEKSATKKAAPAEKTDAAKPAPKAARKKPAKAKASKDDAEPTPPGAAA